MINKIELIDEQIEDTNKQLFLDDIKQRFFIRILTDSNTKGKTELESRIGQLQENKIVNNKYIDYLEEIRGEIIEEQKKTSNAEV